MSHSQTAEEHEQTEKPHKKKERSRKETKGKEKKTIKAKEALKKPHRRLRVGERDTEKTKSEMQLYRKYFQGDAGNEEEEEEEGGNVDSEEKRKAEERRRRRRIRRKRREEAMQREMEKKKAMKKNAASAAGKGGKGREEGEDDDESGHSSLLETPDGSEDNMFSDEYEYEGEEGRREGRGGRRGRGRRHRKGDLDMPQLPADLLPSQQPYDEEDGDEEGGEGREGESDELSHKAAEEGMRGRGSDDDDEDDDELPRKEGEEDEEDDDNWDEEEDEDDLFSSSADATSDFEFDDGIAYDYDDELGLFEDEGVEDENLERLLEETTDEEEETEDETDFSKGTIGNEMFETDIGTDSDFDKGGRFTQGDSSSAEGDALYAEQPPTIHSALSSSNEDALTSSSSSGSSSGSDAVAIDSQQPLPLPFEQSVTSTGDMRGLPISLSSAQQMSRAECTAVSVPTRLFPVKRSLNLPPSNTTNVPYTELGLAMNDSQENYFLGKKKELIDAQFRREREKDKKVKRIRMFHLRQLREKKQAQLSDLSADTSTSNFPFSEDEEELLDVCSSRINSPTHSVCSVSTHNTSAFPPSVLSPALTTTSSVVLPGGMCESVAIPLKSECLSAFGGPMRLPLFPPPEGTVRPARISEKEKKRRSAKENPEASEKEKMEKLRRKLEKEMCCCTCECEEGCECGCNEYIKSLQTASSSHNGNCCEASKAAMNAKSARFFASSCCPPSLSVGTKSDLWGNLGEIHGTEANERMNTDLKNRKKREKKQRTKASKGSRMMNITMELDEDEQYKDEEIIVFEAPNTVDPFVSNVAFPFVTREMKTKLRVEKKADPQPTILACPTPVKSGAQSLSTRSESVLSLQSQASHSSSQPVPPVAVDVKQSFFVSTCGHIMHSECLSHLLMANGRMPREGQMAGRLDENSAHSTFPLDAQSLEFQCPFCGKLCNTLLPLIDGVARDDAESSQIKISSKKAENSSKEKETIVPVLPVAHKNDGFISMFLRATDTPFEHTLNILMSEEAPTLQLPFTSLSRTSIDNITLFATQLLRINKSLESMPISSVLKSATQAASAAASALLASSTPVAQPPTPATPFVLSKKQKVAAVMRHLCPEPVLFALSHQAIPFGEASMQVVQLHHFSQIVLSSNISSLSPVSSPLLSAASDVPEPLSVPMPSCDFDQRALKFIQHNITSALKKMIPAELSEEAGRETFNWVESPSAMQQTGTKLQELDDLYLELIALERAMKGVKRFDSYSSSPPAALMSSFLGLMHRFAASALSSTQSVLMPSSSSSLCLPQSFPVSDRERKLSIQHPLILGMLHTLASIEWSLRPLPLPLPEGGGGAKGFDDILNEARVKEAERKAKATKEGKQAESSQATSVSEKVKHQTAEEFFTSSLTYSSAMLCWAEQMKSSVAYSTRKFELSLNQRLVLTQMFQAVTAVALEAVRQIGVEKEKAAKEGSSTAAEVEQRMTDLVESIFKEVRMMQISAEIMSVLHTMRKKDTEVVEAAMNGATTEYSSTLSPNCPPLSSLMLSICSSSDSSPLPSPLASCIYSLSSFVGSDPTHLLLLLLCISCMVPTLPASLLPSVNNSLAALFPSLPQSDALPFNTFESHPPSATQWTFRPITPALFSQCVFIVLSTIPGSLYFFASDAFIASMTDKSASASSSAAATAGVSERDERKAKISAEQVKKSAAFSFARSEFFDLEAYLSLSPWFDRRNGAIVEMTFLRRAFLLFSALFPTTELAPHSTTASVDVDAPSGKMSKGSNKKDNNNNNCFTAGFANANDGMNGSSERSGISHVHQQLISASVSASGDVPHGSESFFSSLTTYQSYLTHALYDASALSQASSLESFLEYIEAEEQKAGEGKGKGKGKEGKEEETETETDSDSDSEEEDEREGEKEEGEMNGYICDLNAMSVYPSPARITLFAFFASLLHLPQLLKAINIEHSQAASSNNLDADKESGEKDDVPRPLNDDTQPDSIAKPASFSSSSTRSRVLDEIFAILVLSMDPKRVSSSFSSFFPFISNSSSSPLSSPLVASVGQPFLLLPRLPSLPLSIRPLSLFSRDCRCVSCSKRCASVGICLVCGRLLCLSDRCCHSIVTRFVAGGYIASSTASTGTSSGSAKGLSSSSSSNAPLSSLQTVLPPSAAPPSSPAQPSFSSSSSSSSISSSSDTQHPYVGAMQMQFEPFSGNRFVMEETKHALMCSGLILPLCSSHVSSLSIGVGLIRATRSFGLYLNSSGEEDGNSEHEKDLTLSLERYAQLLQLLCDHQFCE
eukprot:MONOS_12438.1-p1 / transcript=MONOS_12438.1 / gene=MONOS_12438 / organism=Monocercomonoides_exilis_PA203 / gene_product=unspecified product / transcript_product=unspecified product / location=Mono_scaffold00689:26657-33900(+) / protein_length=2268 / sequence_SO=supercontig / SO=protein_coding / is_pseudo=false